MDLNKAMIIGNLTRDPESRSTSGGQNVCNFSIATNRIWKDAKTGERKQAVEYHNIVAWGKLGETCSQYCNKGKKVYIEGRLQTRTWDDQAGNKRNRTEIVAESMILLDRSGSRSDNGPTAPAADSSSSDEEIKVEDIPF
ncbi:MAG: single-stranded DNA-binding protein [Patescibacteria group bacterium]